MALTVLQRICEEDEDEFGKYMSEGGILVNPILLKDESLLSRVQNLSSSTMQSLGLNMNDKVTVSGKVGFLRYCGSTDFASGQWAGIELLEPVGKNDGSIAGRRYFTCKPKHGIFAPLTRVVAFEGKDFSPGYRNYQDEGPVPISPEGKPKLTDVYRRVVSHEDKTTPVSPFNKVENPFFNGTQGYDEFMAKARVRATSLESAAYILGCTADSLKIGDKVMLCNQKVGIVRYIGPTTFASGTWAGVELVEPKGKNDGTVAGFRYFICNPRHGIFAPIAKVQKITDDEFYSHRRRSDSSASSYEHSSRNSSTSSSSSSCANLSACSHCGHDSNTPTKENTKTWESPSSRLSPETKRNEVNKSAPNLYDTPRLSRSVSNIGGEKKSVLSRLSSNLSEKRFLWNKSTPHVNEDEESVFDDQFYYDKNDNSKNNRINGYNDNNRIPKYKKNSYSDNRDNYDSRNGSRGDNDTNVNDDMKRPTLQSKKNSINRSTPNLRTPIVRRRSTPTSRTKSGSSLDNDTELGKTLDFKLKPGTLVYHNNDLATLRYIGEVDFADGTWLGIELRKPNGKNDGKVENRRYFTCPPNHGLMVRPSRTWCHGINCSQLINDL